VEGESSLVGEGKGIRTHRAEQQRGNEAVPRGQAIYFIEKNSPTREEEETPGPKAIREE